MPRLIFGLTFLFILFGCNDLLAADSPLDAGNLYLGGGMHASYRTGLIYEDSEGNKPMSIGIYPSFGAFLFHGLRIGLSIDAYRYSRGDFTQKIYGVGPSLVYYLDLNPDREEIRGAYYPYIGFAASYRYTDNDFPDSSEIRHSYGGLGYVGLNFMASEAVGVFGQLGVNYNYEDTIASGGYDMSFRIGFTYFLWNR